LGFASERGLMKGIPLAMLGKKLVILGVLITGVVILGTKQAQAFPNVVCTGSCFKIYNLCVSECATTIEDPDEEEVVRRVVI
jgi:hypothetical protein